MDLGVKVERLLSILMETEAEMNEGMAMMDKRERTGDVSSCDQLTQQLSLCKVRALKSPHSAKRGETKKRNCLRSSPFKEKKIYILFRIYSLL